MLNLYMRCAEMCYVGGLSLFCTAGLHNNKTTSTPTRSRSSTRTRKHNAIVSRQTRPARCVCVYHDPYATPDGRMLDNPVEELVVEPRLYIIWLYNISNRNNPLGRPMRQQRYTPGKLFALLFKEIGGHSLPSRRRLG